MEGIVDRYLFELFQRQFAKWSAAGCKDDPPHLLMPARLLEHHYRETTRDFHELCDMFDASMASMGRRLHQVI